MMSAQIFVFVIMNACCSIWCNWDVQLWMKWAITEWSYAQLRLWMAVKSVHMTWKMIRLLQIHQLQCNDRWLIQPQPRAEDKHRVNSDNRNHYYWKFIYKLSSSRLGVCIFRFHFSVCHIIDTSLISHLHLSISLCMSTFLNDVDH